MKHRSHDITGQRFGRLLVLERAPARSKGTYWRCRCNCGAITEPRGGNLRSGNTMSCTCYSRERSTTHGQSRLGVHTPEYRVWKSMVHRCSNPNDAGYAYYGGRGITVCARWRVSFQHFLGDVGPRPSPKYSLDRIDNNGHYEPGNVRWATRVEQNNNTRRNRRIEVDGVALTIAQAARQIEMPVGTLRTRLARGWSVVKACKLTDLAKVCHVVS